MSTISRELQRNRSGNGYAYGGTGTTSATSFGLHADLATKQTKKPASSMRASQTRFSLGEAIHRPQSVYWPVLVAVSATSILAWFGHSAMPRLDIGTTSANSSTKVLDGRPAASPSSGYAEPIANAVGRRQRRRIPGYTGLTFSAHGPF